jgi:hypothetical protein
LTFEPGSRISTLGESAFAGCSSLRPFRVPSSIQIIGGGCFIECNQLTNLILEAGCQLSAEAVSDLRSNCSVVLK